MRKMFIGKYNICLNFFNKIYFESNVFGLEFFFVISFICNLVL